MDGVVGHLEPALYKQVLHVSITQEKRPIHPDGAPDNHRWEAVFGIGRDGRAGGLPQQGLRM